MIGIHRWELEDVVILTIVPNIMLGVSVEHVGSVRIIGLLLQHRVTLIQYL